MAHALRLTALVLVVLGSALAAQAPGDKVRTDGFGDPLPPGAILRLGTIRWRPSGSIQHLAFAPDGKRLASWHDENHTTAAATIWNVDDGRELRRVELAGVGILAWNWLADGRGIGVVHTSEGNYVWEFSDAKSAPPHKPALGDGGVKIAVGGAVSDNEHHSGFTISPDGKYLAAGKSGAQGGKEREVVLWELATHRRIADLAKPRRLGAIPSSCSHLFFTPDGSKLVAFCEPADEKKRFKEYQIAVVDVASGKELRRFATPAPLQQGSRMSCAVSARYLALGLEDEKGSVLLWNLEKTEDQRFASGHGKKDGHSGFGVSAIAFTGDGKTLITAGRDGAVRTWDVAALKESRLIANAYPGWIETLAVTRDGKRLACAGQDGIIRHWDLTTGTELGVVEGQSARLWGGSMSRDGAIAVTSAAGGRLRIWDVPAGRALRTIEAKRKGPSSTQPVIAPDGRTVVAGLGSTIAAWHAATGEDVRLPELPAGLKADRVDCSSDGKTLLAGHTGAVTLLDWPSGKLRRRFTLPDPLQKPGEPWCDAAALSPDGRWLATLAHRYWYRDDRGMRFGYAADGVLDLWNAATGERVHRLVDGGPTGRNLFFTATGDLLCDLRGKLHAFGGDAEVELQGAFNLIDPLTGRLKTSFEPPLAIGVSHRYNSAMGIAADGRSIYCTGNDGVIHVYEAATGKIRRSLVRHRDYISAVACTADGRRLLTASLDLTALVWDISLAAYRPDNSAAPATKEAARLWDGLTGPDAKAAYAAMAALAAEPKAAVALIRSRIKPVAAAPTDATLERLVAELGDDKFAVRERATRELDQLGEAAVAGIRKRLEKSPPLETHRRLVKFLDTHDPATITPTALRESRALEIQIGRASCRERG